MNIAAAGPGPIATPRTSTIQSVERAADVLRVLSGKPGGASAIEVGAAVQLDRTTVHRLLRTLVGTGLAERRGTAYGLGPACVQLGAGHLQSCGLREAALPFAVDLQKTVIGDRPAVVSISVRAMDEVVIVDRIWTPAAPLSIIVDIGWRFPIDATVSGRAMLSTLGEQEIVAVIGTQRYIALRPRLAQINEQGGLEHGQGEHHVGVGTLACPINAKDSRAIGALVVAGLGLEPELHAQSALADHVRRAARAISQQLGRRG
jgi:IclR family transcriptional regulator, acetate operon repressor